MRVRPVTFVLGFLALGVAVATVLLVGRATGLLPADFRDTPYYEVLYDDGATPADVVEVAEAPEQLVVLDDGTEVRLYGIRDQEGGEAQKAVVQVRRRGAPPVDRAVPPLLDLTSVGDHAVLHSQEGVVTAVHADGSLREVTTSATGGDGSLRPAGAQAADGVEPGDVLVGNLERAYLYRPSDRSVHEVPLEGVEPYTVPVVAVVGGRIWVADVDDPDATTVRWSDDGRTWRSVEYASAGPSAVVGSPDGRTVALVGVDSPEDGPASTGPLHLVGRDGSARPVDPPDEGLAESAAAWTPDGRVLFGNGEDGWWRLDDDGWTRLDVPGDAAALAPAGDRLFASGTRGPEDAAWVSDDAGESWEELGE